MPPPGAVSVGEGDGLVEGERVGPPVVGACVMGGLVGA